LHHPSNYNISFLNELFILIIVLDLIIIYVKYLMALRHEVNNRIRLLHLLLLQAFFDDLHLLIYMTLLILKILQFSHSTLIISIHPNHLN